jgi:hypothetical protein
MTPYNGMTDGLAQLRESENVSQGSIVTRRHAVCSQKDRRSLDNSQHLKDTKFARAE